MEALWVYFTVLAFWQQMVLILVISTVAIAGVWVLVKAVVFLLAQLGKITAKLVKDSDVEKIGPVTFNQEEVKKPARRRTVRK